MLAKSFQLSMSMQIKSANFLAIRRLNSRKLFIFSVMIGNPHLNIDGCNKLVADIKKNSAFWKRYLRGQFSAFTFIQNSPFFAKLYFEDGKSAESIVKEIQPNLNMTQVESLRKYLKHLFRERTEEEKRRKHLHHHGNAGHNNYRLELWGFEDEVIRLFNDGMSAERICKEFNCSADLIRDTLTKHNAYNAFNIAEVYRVSYELTGQQWKYFSDERRADIKRRTNETRKRNKSHIAAREKYLNTVAKRYGADITHTTQIPEIHEKQQRYRYYDYVFKNGHSVKIQGYERFALQELELTYTHDDLLLRETFRYRNLYTNKICVYYADVVIKPTSSIVEVKSLWTIKKYAQKNRSILYHMLTVGANFEFWIFTDKGVKTVVRDMQTFDDVVGSCHYEKLY